MKSFYKLSLEELKEFAFALKLESFGKNKIPDKAFVKKLSSKLDMEFQKYYEQEKRKFFSGGKNFGSFGFWNRVFFPVGTFALLLIFVSIGFINFGGYQNRITQKSMPKEKINEFSNSSFVEFENLSNEWEKTFLQEEKELALLENDIFFYENSLEQTDVQYEANNDLFIQ